VEVLSLGKPFKATLTDLCKEERVRALRDDPSASEGERADAQAKLDEIEEEIGKVEPESPKTKDRAVVNDTAEKVATILFTRDLSKTSPIIRDSIINAPVETYGDSLKCTSRLLRELERTAQCNTRRLCATSPREGR
jgi:hypothetical protein